MRSVREIEQGMKSKNQDNWVTFDEIEWLIDQTKKFEWVKRVITICNDEDLTPKELAKLLKSNAEFE